MRTLTLAAVSCVLVAVSAEVAFADPAADFQRAAETMAAGDYATAADLFEAVGRQHPDDALADDALAKAAQIRERRLGQIARAIALYELVLEAYPRARVARRAQTRLEVLRRDRGTGPGDTEALAKLSRLLNGYADRPRDQTIADMLALVAAHPRAPAAEDARMWLGNAYLRDGWLSESRRWYRQVQATTTDPSVRLRARKAEGDAYLAGGDYAEARAAYLELYESSDRLHHTWADSAIAKLERARRRATLAIWAWLVIGLFVVAVAAMARLTAGNVKDALRAWMRPPTELYYLAPVALLVGGASMRSNVMASRAIIFVFGGALAVTWLSGSTLDLARRRLGRVSVARGVGHAVLAGAAVCAMCYLAVMNDRLLDLLAETWAHGHD